MRTALAQGQGISIFVAMSQQEPFPTFYVALDLALRGFVTLLLLMAALLLIQASRQCWDRRLAAWFCLGVSAWTIQSTPALALQPGLTKALLSALSAPNAFILWLLARALFRSDFRCHPASFALYALISGLGAFACLDILPQASSATAAILNVTAIGFALAACFEALRDWQDDLVEGRRRMRVLLIAGIGGFTGLDVALQMTARWGLTAPIPPFLYSSALAVISAICLVQLFGIKDTDLFQPPVPAAVPAPTSARPLFDGGDLARLQQIMTKDRLYRLDGLTISALAQRLNLPEYRLRRLINQGLGYRNFNAFLNQYRITEAMAALDDPGQTQVPIITIALDTGFQSLGPFNRAFKQLTGLTPSEYRRKSLNLQEA
jgi:AraC-like DNA-binding protein